MKKLVFIFLVAIVCSAAAQPLVRSFPFTMLSRDTSASSDLPRLSSEVAGANGRIAVSGDGHFQTPDGKRIRFFGTELNYSANFLSSTDARDLARRFRKLGINAVRLNYIDHYYYPGASLTITDGNSSYNIDSAAFAKLDTLIYELSQAGIYSLISLQTVHYQIAADGIAGADSLEYPNYMLNYYLDERAGQLQRKWAKTLLDHKNTVTKKRYADDPAIAAVEINGLGVNGAYNFSLTAAWRYGWLNYNGPGSQTLTYHRSRRLDTLYTEYLLRKYGSEAAINLAWRGRTVTNLSNLVEDGSFEQFSSAAWSLAVANGAIAGQASLSPAKDSEFCKLISIATLSTNPAVSDIAFFNTTTRCDKDTLYELRFWAKVRPSAQHPVLARQMYVTLVPINGGAASFGQAIDLDTTWKEFVIPFRPTVNGLQYLYFLMGQSFGDVALDGVTIKRKQETGLYPGESAAARMIARTPYARVPELSYQRVRDISLFYDSVQRVFYQRMIRAIRDTAKSQVLINAFPSWYWSSALEPYANTISDFAQCHINTDYIQSRPGIEFSDSTWMISNTSPLRDAGSYTLGLVASQSIEGKPMVINWINPTMNQHFASMLPFIVGYASLQDWDGIFFSQYTTYRDALFTDRIFPSTGGYSTGYDIAGNPSIVGQFPAISELFRSAGIAPAENYIPIVHTKDDMELLPTISDYRHPFNVEGYLDPNIMTNFKVRQRYNAPTHKVAAEYPFVPDTAAKVSDNDELYWSQSSGHFVGIGKTAATAAGIFGMDTLNLGTAFAMRRTDNLHDPIALTLISVDTLPLGKSALTHLTIAGRGQNTGMVWVDSFGFGNKWGTAPTLMSAPALEFFIRSDSSIVYFHALDELGNRKSTVDAELIDANQKLFKYTIDLAESKSMWYTIEQRNIPLGVRREPGIAEKFDVAVYPNPIVSSSVVAVELVEAADIRLALYDALGREVIQIADERLEAGKYSYDLLVTLLPPGRYLLEARLGANRAVRSVAVMK